MTRERSAGVIVFRSDDVAPDGRVFLLLDYGKYWDLPKGHLEKGEDNRTAALRELKEETGIADVDLIESFAHEIVYFFRDKKKGLIKKSVMFFLAQTQRQRVKLSHEHEDSIWLPIDEAIAKMKYPTAKEAMRAAKEFLDSIS